MTAAVIPIAGLSSRFRAFTETPKWALRIQDKSILELATRSLMEPSLGVTKFIFVHNQMHVGALEEILEEAAFPFEIELVSLTTTPNGQAMSVAHGLKGLGSREPFIVWNGDTALKSGWGQMDSLSGNWMLLSKLAGDHWSFAKLVDDIVVETAEKVRISDEASVGLYAFSSKEIFLDAVNSDKSTAEIYVAPLYNHLLEKGEVVKGVEISTEDFFPLGTPSEVIDTCRKWGVPAPIELSDF